MKFAATVALLLALTAPALAQGAAEDRSQQWPLSACRADLKSTCANIAKGGGQRIACLRANKDKVSPECQAALVQIDDQKTARREQFQVCRADIRSLCGNAGKGLAARVDCLKQHEASVSAACKAVIAQSLSAPSPAPAAVLPPASPAQPAAR